jgi:hypothetical protein
MSARKLIESRSVTGPSCRRELPSSAILCPGAGLAAIAASAVYDEHRLDFAGLRLRFA